MKNQASLRRIPIVAAALSLFAPGLGQAYNGQLHKILRYWIGMILVYTVTLIGIDLETPVGLFIIPSVLYVYVHSMRDAYKSAANLNNTSQCQD